MTQTITARLSEEVTRAELSRMWESERAAVNVPEIVMEPNGNEVTIRFQSSGRDPGHGRLKTRFEEAVRRYRPDCRIDWLDLAA